MYKPALVAGTVSAALSVILGAFGAHALKARLATDQLQVFETGVRYQFYHSFALLIVGLAFAAFPYKSLQQASACFVVGILLFSGSLYAMSLMSMGSLKLGPLGILTPIGGLFFIAGWILFLLGIIKK